MLGGEENIRNYITGAQRASCVDATSAATPQQVREYFAAMILGPILEQASSRKRGEPAKDPSTHSVPTDTYNTTTQRDNEPAEQRNRHCS